MKKRFTICTALVLTTAFIILGFTNADKSPNSSRTGFSYNNDNQYTPAIFPTTAIYTDNFDALNDTTALKLRGYKVYYRGTGPQGLAATWFQGNSTVFAAYNGPATGYVAANYQVVTGTNTIDSWLVLPQTIGGMLAGDTISFRERSTDGTYPDSCWVCYSASDSVPEGTWVVLGRFMNSITGSYQERRFVAPVTSASGRWAIRYHVVGGGPTGLYSDYIGIDALYIGRNTTGIIGHNENIPANFSLDQNYPNPFNPSTNFTFALPKSGNVKLAVYDVLGNEVETVVNEYKQAGTYTVNFNASKLSSGVYFYTLKSGDFTATKKMTLVK